MNRFEVDGGFQFKPVLVSRPLPGCNRDAWDNFLPWIYGKKGRRGAMIVDRIGIGGRYEMFFGRIYQDITPEFLATLLRKGFVPGAIPFRLADTSPATLAAALAAAMAAKSPS